MDWKDLDYWSTGEWQVVEERLADSKKYNPGREDLFRALDLTPFDKVKVVFMGQDPYPNPRFATGVAYSIPKTCKELPPTLANILKEYSEDLGYQYPTTFNLEKWCKRGVLLWNVVPSCEEGKSLSHAWDEWVFLTKEILEKLSANPVVFVFVGAYSYRYLKYIPDQLSLRKDPYKVLYVGHPSPLGKFAKVPFNGSRIFTKINDSLCTLGKGAIDWKL